MKLIESILVKAGRTGSLKKTPLDEATPRYIW
jgi:hypothetical protein